MVRKRIIVLFSFVVFLFISACQATDDINKDMIDVPYTFEVTPESEAWEDMTMEERFRAATIPLDVAERMTTKALLESFLHAPFITGIHSADTFGEKSEESVERYVEKFPTITELLEREDAAEVLESYMEAYVVPEDDSWDVERLQYDVVCALHKYVGAQE